MTRYLHAKVYKTSSFIIVSENVTSIKYVYISDIKHTRVSFITGIKIKRNIIVLNNFIVTLNFKFI